MELITGFIDIVLHLDRHLQVLVADYGVWVYLILFAIIYCETGLVVTPFLPGDSLLFVAGAVAAGGGMDVHTLFAVLLAASFLGDNTNYWVGRFAGPRIFRRRALDRVARLRRLLLRQSAVRAEQPLARHHRHRGDLDHAGCHRISARPALSHRLICTMRQPRRTSPR